MQQGDRAEDQVAKANASRSGRRSGNKKGASTGPLFAICCGCRSAVDVVDDLDCLAGAYASDFGLQAGIFTRDLGTVQRFTEEIGAGIVHVNSQTAGADVHVPFGGIKGSGWGPHEQGRAAIEFYTETVTVYQDAPLG